MPAERDERSREDIGTPRYLRIAAVALAVCAAAIVTSIALRMWLDATATIILVDTLLLFAVTGLAGYVAVTLIGAARSIERAETQARIQRSRLESVIEEMPIGVAVVENETILSLANDRYRGLFGVADDRRVAGLPIPAIRVVDVKGDPVPSDRWPSSRALRDGVSVHDQELQVQRPDGQSIWLSVGAAPIHSDDGEITAAVVTVVDVSQRKTDEVERSRLLEGILEAQEAERLRIARELHDELGQKLTAVSLSLRSQEAGNGPQHGGAQDRIGEARRLVEDLSEAVRNITTRLRPLLLDDVGLGLAVEELALGWGEQMGVAIDTHLGDLPPDLPADIGIVAYRVIQESLTNVARHAAASNVGVTLHVDRGHLRIAVEDDGVGFDPLLSPGPSARHFGLAGMEERVRSVGGNFEIESESGMGTTVFVALPLRR